jgi:hypothetical protein
MKMQARYAGECSVCGNRIKKGELIDYSRETGARHAKCADAPKVTPGPIALHGGEGYGCQGWTVGETILSGEKRRMEGGPDGLTIVTSSRRYIREDGLSFGVGAEQGYAYSATARPATPEELSAAIERAHGAALRMERDLEAKRLETLATSSGEYVRPENGQQIELAGEEIEVSTNGRAYGGGTWWVIEPAGPRNPPAPEELERAKAEHADRQAALEAARARIESWTEANLPANAPSRLANRGRIPHEGRLHDSEDLASLGAKRPEYDALLAEWQGLAYVDSPTSVHKSTDALHFLEQAARLATYPRSVWFVRNNGGDGDDWTRNNVRTGGAGAIDRRLDWSAELERRVRSIRAAE